MYAVTDSAEGDCYLCVPPDPGIEAAALGASESVAPGTRESAAPGAGESALSGNAPTEALHTFTLDSGASRSFFRDSTTLTPLSRPVAVSLADPSGGPVLAHSSTVLLCPTAPSGLLSGLHLPSFSTNLVSGADLQDVWVDQFTPGATATAALAATAALESCATMASLRVLSFDPEGRHVAFDTWHDDLQLYLLSDLKDSVSLFDHVSGVASAPPATADVLTRSQWLSRDATARLAICNHLPTTECAHFGEHRIAQALYDAIVARYSSPATAAIGRLLLPYLFPELSAFATVADLVTHLRTSDARYHATVPTEFLPTNQPPMFITLYFIVTCLPDSLSSVRDHFLTLDPTSLTVDLLEGARPPPFPPPSPVLLLQTSLLLRTSVLLRLVVEVVVGAVVGAAVVVEVTVGAVVGAAVEEVEAVEVVAAVELVAAVEALVAAVEAAEGVAAVEAVGLVVVGLDLSVEAQVVVGASSSSSVRARPRCPSSSLLQSGVAIFDLDFDVIISAMYALSFSAEGDCYRCVPPDPGIAATALGASASGTPPSTAPAEVLQTFTLDSGVSRCFFRDSTTLTPLTAPVPIRLADPSGDPVVASSSTVLPWSSLYTLAIEPPHVAASAQVSASGQVAASCSCRLLSHQTLLWHHRLGHPSLPRLRGMHSRLLVSGLPRAASATILLVVDDYTRYTTVFPLCSKGEVSAVLIPWIRTVRLQLRERFGQEIPVLRLHSNKGGEFSSDILRDFCRGEGITQSFTLPDSPQQNGIAERRIGLLMEVARTSMIHVAAPLFLWPFAVRYAAHQLNLWPRVSLPETSPTLRWTRKSYHPTLRRVLPSHDITFDESVPFYRLFPYRSAPPPPPPLFLASGPPQVDPLLPQGPTPSGVSQVDPLPGTAPVQVAVVSGAAPGAASGGAEPGGAGFEGAGSRGAEPEGVEPGGAESEGAGSWGAEARGASSSGDPAGASPRLSSQQLREWLVWRPHRRSGAPGAGGVGDTGAGGAAVSTGADGTSGVWCAGAGDPTEPGAARILGTGAGVAGVGGPRAGGAGAAGAGVGGTGAGGTGAAGGGAVDPGAGGASHTVRPRPYFIPLLQQVLGVPSTGLPPPFLCPPPDQSQPRLQPASPLPTPSPYTEQSGSLTESREPASRPVLPFRTPRRAPHSRPPLVPGTHAMALCPSSIPQRVPLPAPPESSLLEVPDPESDRVQAASPTAARLLATAVIDLYFESAAASALVAQLLDFAAACRLDYATALVAEFVSASPPSVGGECALGTDVLEDRQEDFECLAAAVPLFASLVLAPEGDTDAPDIPTPHSYAEGITGPYSSHLQAAMDAEMASWKSTGPYVDEVPPPGANIVDGMWIFRGVDYFLTSPTPKMTTLWVLLHVAAQRDYELHSLDFSTAFLQGSLHEEIVGATLRFAFGLSYVCVHACDHGMV
ncbi:unnamed protein product [Closterium sp. NIES-53]